MSYLRQNDREKRGDEKRSDSSHMFFSLESKNTQTKDDVMWPEELRGLNFIIAVKRPIGLETEAQRLYILF